MSTGFGLLKRPNPRTRRLTSLSKGAHAAAVQTAADLGLFKILVENETPLLAKVVAKQCGADRVLIGRIVKAEFMIIG